MSYLYLIRSSILSQWMGVVLCIFLNLVLSLPVLPQNLVGKVISIKDGDTIELLVKKTSLKIRLYGIDCPEKGQDFGNQATQYISQLCFQQEVTVEPHGKDKYGRLLGVVLLKGGVNLNQKMVEAGYAWRYKYSNDKTLLLLQQQAQKKKVGLWIMPNAIAPWEFRKAKHTRK